VAERLRILVVTIVASMAVVWLPAGQMTPAAAPPAGAVVRGSVVDSALNPIPGVTITLARDGASPLRATTDADGQYQFTGVPAGTYKVRAELAGYTTLSRDLVVRTGVDALTLPLVLARPGESLGESKSETNASAPVPQTTTAGQRAQGAVAGAGANGRGGGYGGGGGRGASGGGATPVFRSGVASTAGGVVLNGNPQTLDYLPARPWPNYPPEPGETYTHIDPNRFQSTADHPLSTFGADVDTASYSNVRRFLASGQLPPREAVRVEELVNYFPFAYAGPRDGRPMALTTEIGDCPWAPAHKLVLIGARAAAPALPEPAGRNLVLLIDVSGSMAPPERLPLIRTALGMFVDTLRPDDTISIVTYAGTSGVALYPTPARDRERIQAAIAGLSAGGSTNGGEGLITAYRVARQAFIPGGVNRVILATDGDFNVGIVSEADLQRLIERERDSGVFLSVFGVGAGNLKDRTMEMLADRGNGNYAYLDSLQEARRVLMREGEATLETVAKDVKFQVEFNPARVAAWKLIGYEDRALAAEDFNNDRKDAGDMGAGHSVTVLYEVVPAGVPYPDDGDGPGGRPVVDPLRYQPQPAPVRPEVIGGDGRPGPLAGEWLNVKARYKLPDSDTSELIEQPVRPGGRAQFLPLASAVAEFGLLLRDAPHDVERWDALARTVAGLQVPASMGADRDGFKDLVELGRGLARLRQGGDPIER